MSETDRNSHDVLTDETLARENSLLRQRISELEARDGELEKSARILDATRRLQKLGTLFLSGGNLESILIEIVDAAIAFSGADFGNIQLLDPDSSSLRIVAHRGFPEWWLDYWNGVSHGKGSCGTALELGERVVVEDIEQSSIFIGTPALEIQRRAGVRAVQSTPLRGHSRKPLGMFSTHYKTTHRPDEEELELLDLLALQAADIIERAHTQEALLRGKGLGEALNRVSEAVNSTLDIGVIMQRLVAEGVAAMGSDTGAINLRREAAWVVSYVHGMPESLVGARMNDDQERHAVLAIRTGQPVAVDDAFNDERFDREHLRRFNIRSVLVTPLIARGEAIGALFFNYHAAPHSFTDVELSFVRHLATTASIALENARFFEERRQAEEALRDRENELRLVTNTVPALISYISTDFRYRRVNEGYRRWFSRAPQDIEGRHIRDLVGDSAWERVRPYLERAMAGETISYEEEMPFLVGKPRWVSSTVVPDLDATDRVRGLVAHVTDITDRRRAEDALRSSEHRYRSLFESMAEGYALHEMIYDAEGRPFDYRFMEVNPAFGELTGLEPGAIIGKTVREVIPSIEPFWIETYGRIARTGQSLRFENYVGGLDRWYDVFAYSPAPDHFGTAFTDITLRKNAEETLRKSEELLRRKNAELENFSHLVAHEVKNHLLVLKRIIELSQGDPQLLIERGAVIPERIDRLTAIIDKILVVARAGKNIDKKEKIDLGPLLSDIFKRLKPSDMDGDIHFHWPGPMAVLADPAALEQVFTNLVSNSVRHFDREKNRLIIDVSRAAHHSSIEISYRDNGAGIERDKLECIFDLGFTTDDKHGSGFGLAIARKIIETHGGSIRAESEGRGKGTTFIIILPQE